MVIALGDCNVKNSEIYSHKNKAQGQKDNNQDNTHNRE